MKVIKHSPIVYDDLLSSMIEIEDSICTIKADTICKISNKINYIFVTINTPVQQLIKRLNEDLNKHDSIYTNEDLPMALIDIEDHIVVRKPAKGRRYIGLKMDKRYHINWLIRLLPKRFPILSFDDYLKQHMSLPSLEYYQVLIYDYDDSLAVSHLEVIKELSYKIDIVSSFVMTLGVGVDPCFFELKHGDAMHYGDIPGDLPDYNGPNPLAINVKTNSKTKKCLYCKMLLYGDNYRITVEVDANNKIVNRYYHKRRDPTYYTKEDRYLCPSCASCRVDEEDLIPVRVQTTAMDLIKLIDDPLRRDVLLETHKSVKLVRKPVPDIPHLSYTIHDDHMTYALLGDKYFAISNDFCKIAGFHKLDDIKDRIVIGLQLKVIY